MSLARLYIKRPIYKNQLKFYILSMNNLKPQYKGFIIVVKKYVQHVCSKNWNQEKSKSRGDVHVHGLEKSISCQHQYPSNPPRDECHHNTSQKDLYIAIDQLIIKFIQQSKKLEWQEQFWKIRVLLPGVQTHCRATVNESVVLTSR